LPAGSKFCLNCGAVQGAAAENKTSEAEKKDDKK
jgi:hypothetical protein